MKVHVDGRVMVDPATFRRINPNYPVSTPKSEDKDILSDSESHDSDESESSSDEEGEYHTTQFDDEKKEPKPKKKLVKDKKSDTYHVIDLPVDEEGNVVQKEDIEEIPRRENFGEREFTDEEYLVASPVVLGFSFSEKLWVEFAVSGISDIEWNEGAFDSLIIPHDQKDTLKALVESHAHEAKKNIEDVIQGQYWVQIQCTRLY